MATRGNGVRAVGACLLAVWVTGVMVTGVTVTGAAVAGARVIGAGVAAGREVWVAPGGSDSAAGTRDAPLASVALAVKAARAGDRLVLRPGVYALTETLKLKASGTESERITLAAEVPGTAVLDFSGCEDRASIGVRLDGDRWHLVGLVVRKAPDKGVVVSGSHNVVERLRVSDNGNTGVQLSGHGEFRPSHNLIVNTDSTGNYDPANRGENADGFAAKFRLLGPGNVLRGCRAWHNSDDGYDFWAAAHGVRVEDCWAFENGVDHGKLGPRFAGDGNGFKLGQDSGRHELVGCVAFDNPANGFDSNRNSAASVDPQNPVEHGVRLTHCTGFRNGVNFAFREAFAHELRRNASIAGKGPDAISAETVLGENTWGPGSAGVTEEDVESTVATGAAGPRGEDGSLPALAFLRPREGGRLKAPASPRATTKPDDTTAPDGRPWLGALQPRSDLHPLPGVTPPPPPGR